MNNLFIESNFFYVPDKYKYVRKREIFQIGDKIGAYNDEGTFIPFGKIIYDEL